jgi:hypothetical protein
MPAARHGVLARAQPTFPAVPGKAKAAPLATVQEQWHAILQGSLEAAQKQTQVAVLAHKAREGQLAQEALAAPEAQRLQLMFREAALASPQRFLSLMSPETRRQMQTSRL